MIDQLDSTLLILDHFNSGIKSRTDYLNRNLNFSIPDCIKSKMFDKLKLGIELKPNDEDENLKQISRECTDLRLFLHAYICLNIIDMFSFDDEYNKFFSQNNFKDEVITNRILKVKNINKIVRNRIDWNQLKKFRNNALAHNLRDKNNENNIAISTLKDLGLYLNNIEKSAKYSEIVIEMYKNVWDEFSNEIQNAKNNLKNLTNKKNI